MPPRTARFEAAARVLGEAQRRHHEAARHADEGARPPARLVAGDPVEHRERLVDVLGLHPARSDVLRRSGDRGVAGVEVEVPRVLEVTAHDGALEEVDVLQGVDEASDVVEIPQGGLPVLARAGIDDVHRRARGPEVHLVPRELEIVTGLLTVEHDVAGGVRHRVLDQRAREEEPAFGAELSSGRGDRVDAARDGFGEPDMLQHIERRGVDPLHPVLVEGPEPAADHAGAHRLLFLAKRGRPEPVPCLPSTHAPTADCRLAHGASRRGTAQDRPGRRTRGILSLDGGLTVDNSTRISCEEISSIRFCGSVLANRPAVPLSEPAPGGAGATSNRTEPAAAAPVPYPR